MEGAENHRHAARWLRGLGLEPTALELVHDRPWSRVLRVASADGDLYLKQCAPVQAFEVALTVELTARWPDRMPEVVAADPGRAWLLLRDGGLRLRDGGTLEPFARALELYGELQLGEAAHADELLALGLPDVRLPVLAATYGAFVDADHGLALDEAARLRALAPRFNELCEELAGFGLPASIQHDDLHDANVYVREGQVAIFDWGDSSVSHPFFSWLKPLGVAKHYGVDPDRLSAAYLRPWTAVAPAERLREALRVAVPVGSFAYVRQYQRQLDFMPPEARREYEAYKLEQLRRLLARLAAA
jgi:hypothetical protein